MPMGKVYETGMRITFNAATRTVAVAFRGRLLTLPGIYPDERAAVTAGERYCMQQGWDERPAPSCSLLRRTVIHFS